MSLLPDNLYDFLEELEGSDMPSNVRSDLSADYKEAWVHVPERFPAKMLMLAVLERALLDLFIADSCRSGRKHRRSAVQWILSTDHTLEDGFSFMQVIQALSISDITVAKITELAKCVDKEQEDGIVHFRYRPRCYRRVCRSL